MRIKAIRDSDGEPAISLSDVFSGVGIETAMGLFGIAQRDDGIEVMLDGKTVWTSHEIGAVKELLDALQWCGGSGDFSPEGKAHEGWEKVVIPLLRKHRSSP